MDTLIKDVLHAGSGFSETQAAVSRSAEELQGAANQVTPEQVLATVENGAANLSGDADSHAEHAGQSYTDVAATPENRTKIEAAVKALEHVHPQLTSADSRYQIRMHQDSGKLQVALINTQTGETMEEIPTTKLLEFTKAVSELGGLLFEKHA